MPSVSLINNLNLSQRDKSSKPTINFLDALLVHVAKDSYPYIIGFFYFGTDSHWVLVGGILTQLNNQINDDEHICFLPKYIFFFSTPNVISVFS